MTMKVLIHILCASVALGSRFDSLIHTKIGRIRGLQAPDGDYIMFLGIPYAKVNDSYPFGSALPHPHFEEVFEAYDDSAVCPQFDVFSKRIMGSIDCLRVNIYVPNKANTSNPLPVLVWIYGGGFQLGYNRAELYGPRFLVKKDVIVVSINYRVGPYGFMCLDTSQIPGNQGLKDQVRGLRWVKDNIDAFGGDPQSITVFGESAGSISIDFHLMSKQEKLFHRAIMQSGSALFPFSTERGDKEAPMKIARHLGLDTDDREKALAFLATVEPKLVIAATLKASLMLVPCLEKEFDGVERIVSEHPAKSSVPKAESIPIMAGYNSHEMLVPYSLMPAIFYQNFNTFRDNLMMALDLGNDTDLVSIVRQFYVGDEEPSIKHKQKLIDFESDFIFNHPVHRSVNRHLAYGGEVYHYFFTYSGARNFAKVTQNVDEEGAAHADEVGYLFNVKYIPDETSEQDQLQIERLTTMWTNFAKFGDPTPEVNDILPVKWQRAEKGVLNYLEIGNNLTLKRNPFHERMAFWDLLYKMNIHRVWDYDLEK